MPAAIAERDGSRMVSGMMTQLDVAAKVTLYDEELRERCAHSFCVLVLFCWLLPSLSLSPLRLSFSRHFLDDDTI